MIHVIIPARIESKRLPRKMLLTKDKWPLIVHTYSSVATQLNQINEDYRAVVATDSSEIIDVCNKYDVPVIKTGHHENGTSRVHEASEILELGHRDVIVNVQGDCPVIPHSLLNRLTYDMFGNTEFIKTAHYRKERSPDTNEVKSILDVNHNAIWYTRNEISTTKNYMIHVGVYAYSKSMLDWICNSYIKRYNSFQNCENLEQNEWLYLGKQIRSIECGPCFSIDTQVDYNRWLND